MARAAWREERYQKVLRQMKERGELREAALQAQLQEAQARIRDLQQRLFGGPLVFSAITGGTQTQHWRGGGVGRSLISLIFLFTLQTGIVASHF